MTDNIADWLRAQLDEDERIARATEWDGSGNKLDWELIASATIDVGGDEFYVGDRTIANHMMAWEPARVLREIDAKRRILYLAVQLPKVTASTDLFDNNRDAWAEVLKQLALPYSGRSGYRPEWRP